jgi:hypothetical protein
VSAGLALGNEVTSGSLCQFFAECARRHSANLASLTSVRAVALGKEALPVPRCSFFVECYDLDTRRNTSLPNVTLGKVTSILVKVFAFIVFHFSSDLQFKSGLFKGIQLNRLNLIVIANTFIIVPKWNI